jgi:4-amino-4-deoxy-L-arabinose transferase-like glycosyltransferase
MAAVVLARLAGPMNVDDTDQSKQALYLLDVMNHGNWVLPMERGVEPATKPPVLTWIAAALCAPVGGPSYLVARCVAGLSALLMAWLVFRITSERWTPAVGLVSSWILAASQPVVLLCTHFRTDMLLAFSMTGTLFALHRMERHGVDRRMAWLFWTTVSFAVFVKGPPGLLVLLGTAAVLLFSRRWRALFAAVARSPGWLLMLIPLGWFLLAYGVGGNPYVKFTVARETFDRVTGTGTRAGSIRHPPGYLFVHFLAKGAPWSILALAAVVVALRRNVDAEVREKLHLFAAWLVGPMILFNLSKGQRPDYLLPMLPAASAMAASMLLDPAARRSAAFWRGAVGLFAVAAGLLSLSAFTGTTFGIGALRGFAEDGGRTWAVGIGVSALLAADGLRRRAEAGLLVAIVGILAAQLIYAGTVAPGSAARRGEALVEFSDAVRKERRLDDELHIYGRSITNGVHYYLGLNEPAVPTQLLPGLLDQRRPGRLLLATNQAGSSELQERWPGRFEVLATLRQGRKTDAEHVLLASRRSEAR